MLVDDDGVVVIQEEFLFGLSSQNIEEALLAAIELEASGSFLNFQYTADKDKLLRQELGSLDRIIFLRRKL